MRWQASLERASAEPWSRTGRGVTLAIRATPKAGRDAIDGIFAGADGRDWLSVKLAAAPSDGAANAALIGLIAKELGVHKRDVTLASGASSRLKRLDISGDPAKIAEALTRIIGDMA